MASQFRLANAAREEKRRTAPRLWLRWPGLQMVEIEPVGLLPEYQGRGLGKGLLSAGLNHAAKQGASRATVGAWRGNHTALAMYERLGFRESHSKHYLALDLKAG